MMFKSTEDQYGFGLQQPEQSDYDLYKRLVDIEPISLNSLGYNMLLYHEIQLTRIFLHFMY